MSATVVTIVRGRLDHLRNQRRGLALQHDTPREHVVVRMGGPDLQPALDGPGPACPTTLIDLDEVDPLPLARARNAGAAVAGGSQLVFLDVDCIPVPHLVAAYQGIADRDGLWAGPVWYLPPLSLDGPLDVVALCAAGARHPAQPHAPAGTHVSLAPDLFWSLNFAVRRDTFDRLGGFDEVYAGYGGEDTDLAWTAAAAGVPVSHLADARVVHQHHPSASPPVQHLDAIVANARVFHDKWGRWPMRGWLAAFAASGLIRWDDTVIERITTPR